MKTKTKNRRNLITYVSKKSNQLIKILPTQLIPYNFTNTLLDTLRTNNSNI